MKTAQESPSQKLGMALHLRHAIGTIALVLVAGCAGSRQVNLPGSLNANPRGDTTGVDVQVGSYVRLTLVNGEKLSGELSEASDHVITLVRPRNYAFKERAVAISDIDKLEVLEDAAGGSRLTPVGVMLTTVFVAFLVFVSQLPLHGMD
jgi:subtilisin family serine protease